MHDDWGCILHPDSSDCNKSHEIENPRYDFEALTVARLEKRPDGDFVCFKIIYLFKDSMKKFRIGDELEMKWSRKSLYGLSYFYGLYGKDSSFVRTFYENARETILSENEYEPLLRLGPHNENFWQYMYFCDNRHDIRTRHPDSLDFSETSFMFMRNTPYESWMNNDSLIDVSVATFREYLKDLKKSPKQIEQFENALKARTAIRIDSLKRDYVALGTVWKSVQHNGFCEINFAPRYVFKRRDNCDDFMCAKESKAVNDPFWMYDQKFGKPFYTITAKKQGKCFSPDRMFKEDFLVGHVEGSKLVLDTTYSSWDYIYHDNRLIDVSFGLPYEKFLSYLIPDHFTLDDVITKATYQVFEDIYKNSSKENSKKVERVLKKIDKVCREYD
ncbi:hypothetical protein [Fibrobacter sp. UWEL]|uniref:hypothetical protein n=1 Tax=Fibrobacter sp. UWEL TaxID=1896209 RepID=UPI001F3D7630|nr:hypothetical protein [Fibrobacter sp. UWEL]